MITTKLAVIGKKAPAPTGLIRQTVVIRTEGETGGITEAEADARYMPISPASGSGFLARTAAGVWRFVTSWARRSSGQSLASLGWMRIGTISAAGPTLLDISLVMIRDDTGQRMPSQYRLSISANQDGGNASYCYFGAQLICLYGSDYDGANDDPLLGVALVRSAGYGAHAADLLVQRNGTAYRLLAHADPDAPISWIDPTPVSDPGTSDSVSIALRRIIVAT